MQDLIPREEMKEFEAKFDKQIKALQDKLQKTEIKLEKNNIITEQSTKAIEKMTDTMDSVKEAMIGISIKLGETEKTNLELKSSIQSLNGKFEKLETKVEENEDKTKFDILLYIKQHFVEIVVALTVISYIIYK